MVRIQDAKGLRINTDIIYEEPWALSDAPTKVGLGRHVIRKYIRKGMKSPVTQEVILLECCFLASGQLATSCPAYRRFTEELNGVVTSKET